jgi:ankyrin repeat protein
MIMNDPLLRAEETRLIEAKTKAWNDRFAAWRAANPPTLESLLWIVAKSGYTKEVAPFMNLSKATRECKNLHRVMREVRNKRGITQLWYFCREGMTSSVIRMLEMRSIDVEAKRSDKLGGGTCLMAAASYGHLDICRLLIDKGAPMEAKNTHDNTTLHIAAYNGHLDIVRLLCDRGANIEARTKSGWRPLHVAAYHGHISVVKELIDVRNAEINARTVSGRTALRFARQEAKDDTAAYLVSQRGFDGFPIDEWMR